MHLTTTLLKQNQSNNLSQHISIDIRFLIQRHFTVSRVQTIE